MKLIIDIDEKIYDRAMLGDFNITAFNEAVRNGIPLPKGHGDLIDRKALLNRPYEKGGFVEWYDEIKHAPTIIEADKGE